MFNKGQLAGLMKQAQALGVDALHIGTVTQSEITVNGMVWSHIDAFAKPYENAIADILEA